MNIAEPSTIFIGGLPGEIDRFEVEQYFKKYGDNLRIFLKFRSSGICAGYGLIKVENKELYNRILNDSHLINQRHIECRPYYSSSSYSKYQESFNTRRVYVTKIPSAATNKDLENLFKEIGPIQKAYIIRENKAGNRYHFGYILFKKEEDAEKAVKRKKFTLKGKIIQVRKFDPSRKKDRGKPAQQNSNDESPDQSAKGKKPYKKYRRNKTQEDKKENNIFNNNNNNYSHQNQAGQQQQQQLPQPVQMFQKFIQQYYPGTMNMAQNLNLSNTNLSSYQPNMSMSQPMNQFTYSNSANMSGNSVNTNSMGYNDFFNQCITVAQQFLLTNQNQQHKSTPPTPSAEFLKSQEKMVKTAFIRGTLIENLVEVNLNHYKEGNLRFNSPLVSGRQF